MDGIDLQRQLVLNHALILKKCKEPVVLPGLMSLLVAVTTPSHEDSKLHSQVFRVCIGIWDLEFPQRRAGSHKLLKAADRFAVSLEVLRPKTLARPAVESSTNAFIINTCAVPALRSPRNRHDLVLCFTLTFEP